MKIVSICGSPKKGNTYSTLMSIQKKFPEINQEIIMLRDLDFNRCKGCYSCVLKGEEKCPLNDDRDMIIKKILEADAVIFASPVYAAQVSSIMKNFIDRTAYYAHRPVFFNKFSLSLVTCSGFGGEETTKYMDKIFYSYGFNVVPPLELQYLPGNMPEKLVKLNDDKITKAITIFIERIQKRERNKPSIGILVPFTLFKTVSNLKKDTMTADYEYYKDKSDFWFDTKISFFHKFIAKRVVKKILKKFN